MAQGSKREWKRLYVLNILRRRATFAESLPLSLSVSCTFNHKGNSEPGRMRLPGWSFSHTTSPAGLMQTLPSTLLFSLFPLFYDHLTDQNELKAPFWTDRDADVALHSKSKTEVNSFSPNNTGWVILARGVSCWFNRIRHAGLQRRMSQGFLLVSHLTQMKRGKLSDHSGSHSWFEESEKTASKQGIVSGPINIPEN